MIEFDSFAPNILEMEGVIGRKPFSFMSQVCKIWHNGSVIQQINSPIEIVGHINKNTLNVFLNNVELSKYVRDQFVLNEVSYTVDRLLWSNDLLQGHQKVKEREPGNMSFFFVEKRIERVKINVYRPFEIQLEFDRNVNSNIHEIKNPLKQWHEVVLCF